MYLGCRVRGMILRVDSEEGGDNCCVLFENNAAICSAIDFELIIFDGELRPFLGVMRLRGYFNVFLRTVL